MAVSTLGFASRGGAILGMCFFGVGSLSSALDSGLDFSDRKRNENPSELLKQNSGPDTE